MRFTHVVGVLTSRPVLLKVGSSQIVLRVPLIFQLEKIKCGCLTVQKGMESIPLQGTQSCPGPSLYSLEPEKSHPTLPDCSFLGRPARPGPWVFANAAPSAWGALPLSSCLAKAYVFCVA